MTRIRVISATAPLAQTPMITSMTELKSAKLRGGSSESMIQPYGVPPMVRTMLTISSEKSASRMKMTDRMLNLTGSSASIPAPRPKFLNSCQTQFSRIMPTASATKTLYIVSAAGKYRRNTAISQPSAPKTEVVTRSRPAITCSAIHSTMPSRIPIAYASFQWVYCGGHQPVH